MVVATAAALAVLWTTAASAAPPSDVWDGESLEGFFADYLVDSARTAAWRDPLNFTWALDTWLREHGVPTAEDHSPKVSGWIAGARAGDDPRRKGLADFLEAKPDTAAGHFGEAAAAGLARLGKEPSDALLAQVVRNLELQAGALYQAEAYGEAAEVLRQALGHVSREAAPQRWADLRDRLGLVLHTQGRESSDPAAAQLVREALETYREVLTVRSREELPAAWIETRERMATALADVGDLDGAVLAYQEILAEDPNNKLATHDLVRLYHNRFKDSGKAVEVMGDWLNRHPGDAVGRIVLSELFFATGRFDVCQTMSNALVQATAGIPVLGHYTVVLYVYEAASLLALEAPSDAAQVIREAVESLAAMDGFSRLEWSFEGTWSYVQKTADLPRREEITALFEAAAAGDRDRIVAGLAKVAETLAKGP